MCPQDAPGPTLESSPFPVLTAPLPHAGGSQAPHKVPHYLEVWGRGVGDVTECLWTKSKIKSITAWFLGHGLESMFLVSARAKYTPLFWEISPFWAQLPGQGPHGYHLPPLCSPVGGAGAESALSRAGEAVSSIPARKGTGRNRAEGEGKGRRGHLSSFSVSQEREIFTAGCHNLV